MGIPKEVTKILERHNINVTDFIKAMREIQKIASNEK